MRLLTANEYKRTAESLLKYSRALRFCSNCYLEACSPQSITKMFIATDIEDKIIFGATITTEEFDDKIDYVVHLFSIDKLLSGGIQNDFWQFVNTLPIDWQYPLGIEFAQVTMDILDLLQTKIDNKRFRISIDSELCNSYLCPPDFPTQQFTQLPNGYYLDLLKQTEADWVCNKWKFQSPRTIVTVRHIIDCGRGIAVRSDKENFPIGWALGTQYGHISMLTVEESHKRKGIARVLVARMVEIFNLQNVPTVAIVEEGNFASNELFKSLGWSKSDEDVIWISTHIL